jgi:hypothetical protein
VAIGVVERIRTLVSDTSFLFSPEIVVLLLVAGEDIVFLEGIFGSATATETEEKSQSRQKRNERTGSFVGFFSILTITVSTSEMTLAFEQVR